MNKQETRTGCIVPIIKKQCSPNENESRRDEIIVENKTKKEPNPEGGD